MKLASLFGSAVALGAVLLSSTDAHAAEQSRQGPGYVQLNFPVWGFHLDSYNVGPYSARATAPIGAEFHGGYHFSGRHDGWVIGGTQKVVFNQNFWAATMFRFGYDFAIPIKKFDLIIAPYGQGGIAYGDGVGGSVRPIITTGVEARFFPFPDGGAKGFFGTARPLDLGFVFGDGHTSVAWSMALGAGWAF